MPCRFTRMARGSSRQVRIKRPGCGAARGGKIGTDASQDLGLLPLGQRPNPIQHGVQDGIISTGHGADRPIRADHQAPRAELLQGNLQVSSEVLRPPPLPIGTVGQSRELAIDVWAGRQLRQPGLPWGQLLRPDVGEAEVVEHEALLGKLPHELHGGRHVPWEDEQVVREAERREGKSSALQRGRCTSSRRKSW
jgi:hypothetical protein